MLPVFSLKTPYLVSVGKQRRDLEIDAATYLEGRSPAGGLDQAGMEDGEIDERVGRNKEIGEQGRDNVEVA
jgi:hypothetical protein